MIAVMDSQGGPQVETPVTWTFGMGDDSFEFDGNPGRTELRPGKWTVTGYHVALEQEQVVELTLSEGQSANQVMVFASPETSLPTATVAAPAQVVVGSAFAVSWQAEGLNPRDYVTIVSVGADEGAYQDFHRLADKSEGELRAPAEPGLYEVRLQLDQSGRVLASTPVEVVDAEVSLTAPAQVVVGSAFAVTWQAEGLNPRDYVTIVPASADEGAYEDFHRLADKS